MLPITTRITPNKIKMVFFRVMEFLTNLIPSASHDFIHSSGSCFNFFRLFYTPLLDNRPFLTEVSKHPLQDKRPILRQRFPWSQKHKEHRNIHNHRKNNI